MHLARGVLVWRCSSVGFRALFNALRMCYMHSRFHGFHTEITTKNAFFLPSFAYEIEKKAHHRRRRRRHYVMCLAMCVAFCHAKERWLCVLKLFPFYGCNWLSFCNTIF